MEELNTQQPTEQPQTEQPTEEVVLPSEQQEQAQAQADIETLSKGLEQFVKDGMIDGKFKTVEDLIQSYRDLEAKYANTRREMTQSEKQQQTQQEQAALVAKQQEVINDLLPKFIENGMSLTPEMVEKAKEVGIDEKDLKLGAYELKEITQKAYSVVGGKDNYQAMIDWAKENLPDDKKAEFDRGLQSNMSEFAIKGLWTEYQKAVSNGTATRLQGKPATSGLKPYQTRQELFRDKDFAEAAKRRGDMAAWNKYRQRLAITPEEVILGR